MSPCVAFATEHLVTLAASPAFFLFFPGPLPRSRCEVACGWRGAFKLQLVDSRREIHINILALQSRLPICGTTERQSGRCGKEARLGRGCAGLQVAQILCVTWFSVRLLVEDLFKGFIVFAEELVAVHVLFGHRASDVVSTQTIVQLTLDRNSSWVSPSGNPLPQKLSLGYKSFSCAVCWPQFADVLLTGMYCITKVNDHVVKGRDMGRMNADLPRIGGLAVALGPFVTTHR